MEDPASWKRAENVILDAHHEWHKMNDAGAFGPSIAAHIANELRKAGLLLDDAERATGYTLGK